MALQTFTAGQTLTATQMNTLQASTYNYPLSTQSGSSYTLASGDAGHIVIFTSNNNPVTVTVPLALAINEGDSIEIVYGGTGSLNIEGAVGVTINSEGSLTSITSRWARVSLVKTATNTFLLSWMTAITEAEIVNGSVTANKLATDAVQTAKIQNDAVTSAKLADSASVDADRAVTTNHIRDLAVTNDKIRQSANYSVMGNSTSTTANVADITASTDNTVLRRNGTSLGFAKLVNANIDDAAGIASTKLGVITITTQSGASPQSALSSYANCLITIDSSSAYELRLPASDVDFPVGTTVSFLQKGTGRVTFAAGTGTPTIRTPISGAATSRAQWSVVTAIKIGSSEWLLAGDLAT